LDKWLRNQPDRDRYLRLSREQILTRDPGADVQAHFPSTLHWQGVDYRLRYQFEPGRSNDGVSVTIPLPLLNRAPRYRFDWLVPGLLRDKCIAMLKGLPKGLRKQLVPVPDVVDGVLAVLEPDDTDLAVAMARVLKQQRGIVIQPADWGLERLEDFYRMNIRVVDDRGKLLAQGRDMAALVAQFRDSTPVTAKVQRSDLIRERVTRWDFGDLPAEVSSRSAGLEVVSYPALVDRGDSVAVDLFDYPAEAMHSHRRGVAALAAKASAQTAKYLRKNLFADNAAALAFAASGIDRVQWAQEVILVALLATADGSPLPRDQAAFESLLEQARGTWVPTAMTLERQLMTFLTGVADTLKRLSQYSANQYSDSRQDIQQQIRQLAGPGALLDAPANWLAQYPRYGRALAHRAERLSGQYGKDQKSLQLLAPHLERLEKKASAYPGLLALSAPAQHYRWMLEEFRVSLFAQQLGTKTPVSAKRLDEQWLSVEQWLLANPR